MIDLYGYVMFGLVAVLAVGQAVAWARGWHRDIGRLQEQARLRAQAAHRRQIAILNENCVRYSLDPYEGWPHGWRRDGRP